MHITKSELSDLADAYMKALAGQDIRSAILLHADKAGINLDFVDKTVVEPALVQRVFKAAQGQRKLERLLHMVREDGFDISVPDLEHQEPAEYDSDDSACRKWPGGDALPELAFGGRLPRLKITRYASYLPTSTLFDDPSFRLLEGRILNPVGVPQRVFLTAHVAGASDVVKAESDIPPAGADIPRLRMPRFTRQEAAKITQTIVPSALDVELYLPGIPAPVDSFQRDIWLSQPDVVLIARRRDDGRFEDHTPALAWWVNSGATELTNFLIRVLPSDIRENVGYSANHGNSTECVDRQVQALYEGIQQLSITFMPTELIWTSGEREILQRAQRPEKVLDSLERRANCLDGAILFASLLERMSLDPILVLVPKHALVGWKRQPVSINLSEPLEVWQTCGFIDPTYLGTNHGFDTAVSAAEGHFNKHRNLFGRRTGTLREFARIVDIKAARGLPPSGVVV